MFIFVDLKFHHLYKALVLAKVGWLTRQRLEIVSLLSGRYHGSAYLLE